MGLFYLKVSIEYKQTNKQNKLLEMLFELAFVATACTPTPTTKNALTPSYFHFFGNILLIRSDLNLFIHGMNYIIIQLQNNNKNNKTLKWSFYVSFCQPSAVRISVRPLKTSPDIVPVLSDVQRPTWCQYSGVNPIRC